MNVEELITLLQTFPKDMEVIRDEHSDFTIVEFADKVTGVDKGTYVMRTYDGMLPEHRVGEKEYLLIC
jgi:hypothetical protein